MQLEKQISESLKQKDILLMTHIVLGFPSRDANRRIIEQMVNGGVDIIEMQIPFSEPMADGPVIVRANQEAIEQGTKVRECLEFAREITKTHDIPFLFMTYYNILYQFGVEEFLEEAKKIGIKGLIIPDLPPEEGENFYQTARRLGIAPIMIYAPTSTPERMKFLAEYGDGFVYCVARKGVTGAQTDFDAEFQTYIDKCRKSTDMPLAVGFGISSRQDIEYLTGKTDIAVIGTKTIKLVEEEGIEAVEPFIKGLRH